MPNERRLTKTQRGFYNNPDTEFRKNEDDYGRMEGRFK